MMKDKKVRQLVLAALFAALCCVMTMVIQIPSPMNGYVNLGDCGVLLAAWALGPIYGGAAAGIGSALADIFSGYAHYAPATFLIKGMMAVAAALIFRAVAGRQTTSGPRAVAARLAGAAVAETIMVMGYFLYAALLLGNGLGAAASIPGNVVQGVFGLVAGVAVAQVLFRSRAIQPQ